MWSTVNTFNKDAGNYYVHVKDAYGCIYSRLTALSLGMDATPVIAASVTNQCTASVGTFEIDVTLPTAGIAPYSFSINNGAFQTGTVPFTIKNLASGTHTIQIQDANGCGNTVSVTIEPPVGLTPTITTLPSCSDDDGVINVAGSGGTGTYSYTHYT